MRKVLLVLSVTISFCFSACSTVSKFGSGVAGQFDMRSPEEKQTESVTRESFFKDTQDQYTKHEYEAPSLDIYNHPNNKLGAKGVTARWVLQAILRNSYGKSVAVESFDKNTFPCYSAVNAYMEVYHRDGNADQQVDQAMRSCESVNEAVAQFLADYRTFDTRIKEEMKQKKQAVAAKQEADQLKSEQEYEAKRLAEEKKREKEYQKEQKLQAEAAKKKIAELKSLAMTERNKDPKGFSKCEKVQDKVAPYVKQLEELAVRARSTYSARGKREIASEMDDLNYRMEKMAPEINKLNCNRFYYEE